MFSWSKKQNKTKITLISNYRKQQTCCLLRGLWDVGQLVCGHAGKLHVSLREGEQSAAKHWSCGRSRAGRQWRRTWVMASSSASTASSSSCDSEPASISSICCTQRNIRLRLQQKKPWNSFRVSCTHPLVFDGILSFIHDALYLFNRHHLTQGGRDIWLINTNRRSGCDACWLFWKEKLSPRAFSSDTRFRFSTQRWL